VFKEKYKINQTSLIMQCQFINDVKYR